MKTSLVLLLFLPCLVASGGEAGFFRVGCLEGEAAKNLAIASGEFGDIFLEFDTEDQYTYTIEATGRLHPDSAWTTLSSVARHGGRVRCTTTLRWATTLGGSAEDAARCIQQTSDGGYIVAGYTRRFGAGGRDVYLIKMDQAGSEVWSTTFGEWDVDGAYSVQQTADGGYILAGYTQSFGAGGRDVYLIKMDQYFRQVWSEMFGGDSDDGAYCVQQTTDGGYIVAGYTRSFGAGSDDVYLIKTDKDGSEVWRRTFGGSDVDGAHSVLQTSDGGYIVAGYTWSFGAGLEDVYLVRTDRNGNEVWPQLFGGSGGDRAHSVQPISDGGCIVAGSTSSFGAEVEDVYVIKTDANGSQFWSPTFGGSSEDRARSVQPTSDGGYIVAGQTSSFGAGESDVWLIKTDPNGTEVWSRTFGGSGRDWANEIQQTSDGGYIVAGWTDSFGVGQDDLYLIKTDRYGYAPFP